ncbi:uncharacterized protein [Triticum aestivum]|uniref:uncharacterized protein n=1 Tax=Triticum aestivum TaxID=4565 RepID=UPI001D0226B3|nr:uncharacterized protein LOC123184553 [Triticum aestivum]
MGRRTSVHPALGSVDVFHEIFIRLDSCGDLVRVLAVSPAWCAAANMPGFLKSFRKREFSFFLVCPAPRVKLDCGAICTEMDEPVHYHVNEFVDGAWELAVSEAMEGGGGGG